MATLLASTSLVDKTGAPYAIDPTLPVYLYFGAKW
jgi:hypothetical protein